MHSGPIVRALASARGSLPTSLERFDALARGAEGEAPPSFEEYSASIEPELVRPWRTTVYFDVGADPALAPIARRRFSIIASQLGFGAAATFADALDEASLATREVLQLVLGFDAASESDAPPRLKFYVIFRGDSRPVLDHLRAAAGNPALPDALDPARVYILGVDFEPGRCSDFKLYVRLDPARAPALIRNHQDLGGLWTARRYLVFQHCTASPRRQVYVHASTPDAIDDWLAARDDAGARGLQSQIRAMNEALGSGPRLRPWIVSLPWREGQVGVSPSNVYFHLG